MASLSDYGGVAAVQYEYVSNTFEQLWYTYMYLEDVSLSTISALNKYSLDKNENYDSHDVIIPTKNFSHLSNQTEHLEVLEEVWLYDNWCRR